MTEQKVKIPAAWLIEQCGFKGQRQGPAGVHQHQALVLINLGKATGQDIKSLADTIEKTVFNQFAIRLENEVNII